MTFWVGLRKVEFKRPPPPPGLGLGSVRKKGLGLWQKIWDSAKRNVNFNMMLLALMLKVSTDF